MGPRFTLTGLPVLRSDDLPWSDTSSLGVAHAFLEEQAMASTTRIPHESDQALVHAFIRVVGRRPTREELRRDQTARPRLLRRWPGLARRVLARAIIRL